MILCSVHWPILVLTVPYVRISGLGGSVNLVLRDILVIKYEEMT